MAHSILSHAKVQAFIASVICLVLATLPVIEN